MCFPWGASWMKETKQSDKECQLTLRVPLLRLDQYRSQRP